MSFRMISVNTVTVLLYFITSITTANALSWKTLTPGLEYTEISAVSSTPWGQIHAFRLDPKRYQLGITFAKDQGSASSTVKTLGQAANALISINGGFFTPAFEPIGLRITNGHQFYPLKNTSWWGIFALDNNQAKIFPPSSFNPGKKWDFAIQSGPRLLVSGNIPKLKPGLADRTALGITKDHHIIIFVTHNAPMTTTEAAVILRNNAESGGLNCTDALNLDGGSSSQLYAAAGDLTLDLKGFSTIADAVTVTEIH